MIIISTEEEPFAKNYRGGKKVAVRNHILVLHVEVVSYICQIQAGTEGGSAPLELSKLDRKDPGYLGQATGNL